MYTQFLTPSLARKKGDKAEGVGVRAGESADYVLYSVLHTFGQKINDDIYISF